jgi:hypothetical protein
VGSVLAADNPYPAGFGIIPPTLGGRDAEFSDLQSAVQARARSRYAEPRLVTGDRGYGKTVLVAELAKQSRDRDLVVLDAEAVSGSVLLRQLVALADQELRARSADYRAGAAARTLLSLLGAVSLRYGGGEVTVEFDDEAAVTGDLTLDTTALLARLDTFAREHETGVLVTVDEIQKVDGPSIAAVLAAIQALDKRAADPRDAPRIALVLTGLPESRSHLRRVAGTYASDRVSELELTPLLPSEVIDAVDTPATELGVRWTADALEILVDAADGYPYAVQLMARGAWNAADGHAQIDAEAARAGIADATDRMTQMFTSRWHDLPHREREYLRAVADTPTGQRTTGNIAATLGKASPEVASYRRRLIEQRRLLREHDSKLVFTLPGLEGFVSEQRL